MSAGVYNLTIEQAATFQLVATWKDANDTAINLTGYSAAMDVRAADGSLVVDVGASGTLALGGTAGTVTITVPAATTATLTAGNHHYDLYLTSSGGVVTRLLTGRADVVERITS